MNLWVIAGRLTKQPQVKTIGDKEVCSFSVAVNETKNNTLFVDCDWWGNGKFMESLIKGTFVTVQGSLKTRVWTTKEGIEKTVIGCRVDRVIIGGKPDSSEPKVVRDDVKKQPANVVVEEPEEDDIPF